MSKPHVEYVYNTYPTPPISREGNAYVYHTLRGADIAYRRLTLLKFSGFQDVNSKRSNAFICMLSHPHADTTKSSLWGWTMQNYSIFFIIPKKFIIFFLNINICSILNKKNFALSKGILNIQMYVENTSVFYSYMSICILFDCIL